MTIECPNCEKPFKQKRCPVCDWVPERSGRTDGDSLAEFRAQSEAERAKSFSRFTDEEEVLASVQVTGPRAWAYKILSLHNAGLPVQMYALQCAQEVVGGEADRKAEDDDEPVDF